MLDVVIRNARVYDGSGSPWYRADVGILGDRILEVGCLDGCSAGRILDVGGLALAPGFIDIHTHSDLPLLIDGRAMSHVLQGVTTNVIGNCGSSLAPVSDGYAEYLQSRQSRDSGDICWSWRSLGEYLDLLEKQGTSVNVIPLVGQGTIRGSVMGFSQEPASPSQLEAMTGMAAQAMEDGAFGLSTGLIYTPGCYAETGEIVPLARVASRYGGIYATHIRGENDSLPQAVKEAVGIGLEAQIPVQISHIKAMGRHMWGKSKDIIPMLEEARQKGLDVTADLYPYEASATGLEAFLPPWTQEGGAAQLSARLQNPETRKRITRHILEGIDDWTSLHKGVGWENTMITNCQDSSLEGKTVADIAQERNQDPFDTAYDILMESQGRTSVVYFTIGEEDMRRFMTHEIVMIGSDSSALSTEGPLSSGKPHPRSFGTFTRVLGRHVREERDLTLAQAIVKMTSLPATRMGLGDRGLIRPGMKADLVIFDPETVMDRSTYQDPHQYPVGISHVFVNGFHTVEDGRHLGTMAGSVLRKGSR